MIIHCLKHATTDVLPCLELLENQFRVQFMKFDHKPAGNLRRAACFVWKQESHFMEHQIDRCYLTA